MSLLETAMRETTGMVDVYRKAARQQLPNITAALARRTDQSFSSYTTESSERYRFFRHWVYICFPAGTEVFTIAGIRNIEDIQSGDSVLTHRGHFKKVTKTSKRNHVGEFISIETIGRFGFECTPNHPIYVMRGNRELWIPAVDVRQTDLLIKPTIKSRVTECSNRLVEVFNKNLSPSDWRHHMHVEIELTEDAGRLLGLFLAEGHVRWSKSGSGKSSPRTVAFSFSEDEHEYHHDVLCGMREIFGIKTSHLVPSKGCLTLLFNSRIAAEWFLQVGHGASNKYIPQWCYDSPLEFRKGLIAGYIDGDGCHSKRMITYTTASKSLGAGIAMIAQQFGVVLARTVYSGGVVVICGKQSVKKEHVRYTATGRNYDLLCQLTNVTPRVPGPYKTHLYEAECVHNAGQSKNRIHNDGGCNGLFAIKTIAHRVANEEVYNLEVADDESYCADGFAVHNCVDSISNAVASLPWKAAEITNAEENPERSFLGTQQKVPRLIMEKAIGTQELLPVMSHPSLDLMCQPNEIQGKDELIYFTVANLEIIGCAYWILGTDETGKEPRVFGVPATWVTHDRKSGNYLLKTAGSQEPVEVPAEYVAKMSFPNPSDPLGHYSPLNACLSAIKVDDYIQRSQQQSFDRGIHPNLIVTVAPTPGEKTRPTLTGAQRRQFIRAIREVWSQTVNVGDPAIVDGMISSVTKLQSTPQEMDWPSSGEIVKKRIMQTYRVNPYMVGDVTGMNKAQAIVAQAVFNEQVVNPIAGSLSNAMTALIGPRYDTPKRLVLYLEEAKAVDREQRLREWSTLRRSDDVTQNEYRAAILGLPPLDEREDHSGLLSLVGGLNGITTLLQQVGMGFLTTDQAIQILVRVMRMSEEDARAIVGSQGRIALPEEVPTRSKSFRKDKSAIKALHLKRVEMAESELDNAVRQFLSDTYNDWVKQISNSSISPDSEDAEGQAEKVMSKIYNPKTFLKELWTAILAPQVMEFLAGAQDEWEENKKYQSKMHTKKTSAQSIADELGIDVDKILEESEVFDIALELPEFMIEEAMKTVAESASQPYWVNVGDTFTMRVQSKLEMAIKEGLSISEIAKSLLKDADNPDSTWIKARAKAIARTESSNMLNAGHNASREQLAEDTGLDLRNSWMSVLGSTTREAHANLDGELADEDGMFNLNGVMIPWPSHYSLPAGDRINCQCGITTEPYMG